MIKNRLKKGNNKMQEPNINDKLDELLLKHTRKKMIEVLKDALQECEKQNTESARYRFKNFYEVFASTLERQNIFEEIELYHELQKLYVDIKEGDI
jgi:uncharacterized Zn finger protein